jgi:hypothetical protein
VRKVRISVCSFATLLAICIASGAKAEVDTETYEFPIPLNFSGVPIPLDTTIPITINSTTLFDTYSLYLTSQVDETVSSAQPGSYNVLKALDAVQGLEFLPTSLAPQSPQNFDFWALSSAMTAAIVQATIVAPDQTVSPPS